LEWELVVGLKIKGSLWICAADWMFIARKRARMREDPTWAARAKPALESLEAATAFVTV
jgi:hypothetical protein